MKKRKSRVPIGDKMCKSSIIGGIYINKRKVVFTFRESFTLQIIKSILDPTLKA